jgi:hypothetical protein
MKNLATHRSLVASYLAALAGAPAPRPQPAPMPTAAQIKAQILLLQARRKDEPR